MKKQRKKFIAGVLAVSMVLGNPAGLKALEAAGQTKVFTKNGIVITDGGDYELGGMEESTQEQQDEPESSREQQDESESETIRRETLPSEGAQEEATIQAYEMQTEVIAADQKEPVEETKKQAEIITKITDDGILDYRTYIKSDQKPKIHIRVEEISPISIETTEVPKSDENQKLSLNGTTEEIVYMVTIDNSGVIDFEPENAESHSCDADAAISRGKLKQKTLITKNSDLSFQVKGVGKTNLRVESNECDGYILLPSINVIEVKNSSLYDEDFYIEVTPGRQTGAQKQESLTRKYNYQEWTKYLNEHQNWVNGSIKISLSDEGANYYTKIKTEKEAGNKTKYTFWAENPDNHASTRNVNNGTRTFMAGIDTEAPAISVLTTDSKCYEPTRTDTRQYFAQDFVLKGSYTDSLSGVRRVEYTTDATAGDRAVWQEAAVSKEETGQFGFEITLSDGRYDAIAVRACDYAGNVSEVTRFVNDKDDYIQIVVDKSEPVIRVTAVSGENTYVGEYENWTKNDVVFDIAFDEKSCPYAGIYRYEYAYEKIGEVVNNKKATQMSEKWIGVKPENAAACRLEITEDKNGYYYFKAVSKSGVRSSQLVKQRVLIQHQPAQIKPLVINGANDTKRSNEWYNKASGVPKISFEYPEYDTGILSEEYDAPITIHYTLTAQTEENGTKQVLSDSAKIGVLSCDNVIVNAEGKKEFVLTKEDINKHVIDFGYNPETGYAQDGIYTLEYWTTDQAGNQSEKQKQEYKIDSHEPTALKVMIDGTELPVNSEVPIVYERFYQNTISGNAQAEYGISGKGSIQIVKAKRHGAWKEADSKEYEDGAQFDIAPNTRCFLYVRAQDDAGNIAEGWTRGIVADNMKPNEENGRELIIEPKGANKHGFYKDDVTVKVSIQDAPENENCASLSTVICSVGKDGLDTVTDENLFSFDKELPTSEELTGASSFETVQIVNAKENESNEAYIEITATDRSGNTKTSARFLKIDVTKPQIDIRFDNDRAVNGRFYNQSRTAVIHVHELNFDASAVEAAVTRDGVPIHLQLSDWTHEGSDHYASVTFAEDGDYSMEVSCTDLAGNISEHVQADSFTIDTTAPEVSIALSAQQQENAYEDCFSSGAVVTITVTEHNFHAEDFELNIKPMTKKFAWRHEGDRHSLQLTFDEDGFYQLACTYADLAGNTAKREDCTRMFTIDTTAPLLAIAGVENGSANAGEVLPVVTVLDLNTETSLVNISVRTGSGQSVETTAETSVIDDENGVGYRFALSDMREMEDNIYYLTVSAHDKAGNKAALTYRFSINKQGSTYDLTALRRIMEKRYNPYAAIGDIQIMEMNIDTVDEFAVYISRNGELGSKAVYEREISGSDNTGYTYIYHIKRENFAKEGSYRLSLYSKDRAGNERNNIQNIDGNEISFVIDNTAPKVVIDGVESGRVYDAAAQKAGIVVTDNFKLSEAEFTLVNKENEVLERWDYMELSEEGQTMYITIPQYDGEVSLLYRVKDAAGNELQTYRGEDAVPGDFLVTTDKLVQFVNKPLKTSFGRIGIALIAVTVTLAGGAAAASQRYKRKHMFEA